MEVVDDKTFKTEMADKTDKFCIAEHGLVGLGYPFQDSVKTNTSLRPSDLYFYRDNSNCNFDMKRPELHTFKGKVHGQAYAH